MSKSIKQESNSEELETRLDLLSGDIRKLYDKEDNSSLIKLAETFLEISDLKLPQGKFSEDVLKCYTDAAKHLKYVDAIVNKIPRPTLSDEETSQVEFLEQNYHNKISTINDLIVQTVSIIECKIPQCSNVDDEIDLSCKPDLQGIRDYVKGKLQDQEAKGKRFDVKSKFTERIYKEINMEMKQYLANLFWDAERVIGKPPCKYSVLGLGSMALGQMTPYSDLEFAILTENEGYKNHESQRVKDYFKNLCHYIHFKVILLGETVIKDYGVDLTHVMKRGTQFDPGEKTPLGESDLVRTVDGMITLLRDDAGVKKVGLDAQHIIEKTCFVCESDGESFKYSYEGRIGSIAEEYQNKVANFLQELGDGVHQNCLLRGVKRLSGEVFDESNAIKGLKLKGNLEEFGGNFGATDAGKVFNIKYEIYRLADRFIYNLSLICKLVDLELSTWDVLKKLVDMCELSEGGGSNLMEALSFATILRLKVYDHYEGQKERVDFRGASDLGEVLLRKEDLSENGSLFEFYYRVLPLIDIFGDFIDGFSAAKSQEAFFRQKSLYGNNVFFKGKIYFRLLNCEMALHYFEESLCVIRKIYGDNHPDVALSLNNIGGVYDLKGEYNKALGYFEESLGIYKFIYGNNHQDVAMTLNNIGGVYDLKGEYDMALDYYQESLCVIKKIYGNDHPWVAFILNNIGGIYGANGKYDEALDCYKESLHIKSVCVGTHPSVATYLNNMGIIYRKKGDYKEALDHYEKSLHIKKIVYGDNHPDVAMSLNNIGVIYQRNGACDKALIRLQEALSIYKSVYGDCHPSVGTTLNNIGMTYHTIGKYDEALVFFEESLAIMMKVYGDNHLDVALLLHNIGSIYDLKGWYDEALCCHEKSLCIRDSVYGNRHPDVASSLNNIGLTYQENGDYHKSLDCIKKSLETRESFFGNNHPDVASSLNNIGLLYKEIGESDEALKCLERALNIDRSIHGNNHPDVATSLNNIGLVYQEMEKYDKALDCFKESLRVREGFFDSNHPDISTNLNNIGVLYQEIGNCDEALIYLERSLNIDKSIYGSNHPDVASDLNNIGGVYDSKGEYNKALDYFEESLHIYKSIYGNNHPDVALCINNIGMIYKETAQYDKALKYFRKSLAIRKMFFDDSHQYVQTSLELISVVEQIMCCEEPSNGEAGVLVIVDSGFDVDGVTTGLSGQDEVTVVSTDLE